MKLTALKARVRLWQNRSGLSDWNITVATKMKLRIRGDACHAAIECVDQRATMTFDEDTLNRFDKNELDHLICHELQHIIDDAAESVLLKGMGKGTVYRGWEVENEKACDHRASVMVNAYKRKRDRHSK